MIDRPFRSSVCVEAIIVKIKAHLSVIHYLLVVIVIVPFVLKREWYSGLRRGCPYNSHAGGCCPFQGDWRGGRNKCDAPKLGLPGQL